MAPLAFTSVALLALGIVQDAVASKTMPMKFSSRPKLQTLRKRADPFSASIQNYIPGAEYFITASVGTPAQTLELIVDTGSSDVWMFAPDVCHGSDQDGPCIGGSFDSTSSSTYELLYANAFEIQYADGSGVKGDYIQDNFAVGGQVIKNLIMAVATKDSSNTAGIMGIGLDTRESYTQTGSKPYPNLPDSLLAEGLISTKAYSLYLDDAASASGTLLFGGYDTEKFHGDLIMMPLLTDSQTGIVDGFEVAWTSLSISDSSGNFSIDTTIFPAAVTLDSGSTLATLPTNIYKALANAFSVDDSQGEGIVSCALGSKPGSIDFGFGGEGGPVIAVPFSEIALPSYNPDNGQWQTDNNGNHVCVFGFQDVGQVEGGDILFGQTILRSAYILYDLDNLQLGIAQTNFDSTSSNVVEYNGKSSTESISSDSNEPQPTAAASSGYYSSGGNFNSATLGGSFSTGVPSGAFAAGGSTAEPGVVVYSTSAAPVAVPSLGETYAAAAATLSAAPGAGSGSGSGSSGGSGSGSNSGSSGSQNLASSVTVNMSSLITMFAGMLLLGVMGSMILL